MTHWEVRKIYQYKVLHEILFCEFAILEPSLLWNLLLFNIELQFEMTEIDV